MKRVAFLGESVMLERVKKIFLEYYPEITTVFEDDQDLEEVDVLICWKLPEGKVARMPGLRLVHSVGAGCESIVSHPLPKNINVCRVVDNSQVQGMVDYCTWAALYYYRELDKVLKNSRDKVWEWPNQVPKNTYKIGVMGLGNMGANVAESLLRDGFSVAGWSRTRKQINGIDCYAGNSEIGSFVENLDLVICLLPLTSETRGILNSRLFAAMKPRSVLVNLGRGEHIVEVDLLAALQERHLRGALLDVFEEEPLDESSQLWETEGILVTPHMASASSPEEIARQIHENISRLRNGKSLLNVVNNNLGY